MSKHTRIASYLCYAVIKVPLNLDFVNYIDRILFLYGKWLQPL